MKAGNARATAIGAVAIAIFSTMALLASQARALPPFQLLLMAFALATILTGAVALARGEGLGGMFRQPPGAWATGVGGFFGFHFAYFLAFQHTSPVEASLICYLWPLLIIVFASFGAWRPGVLAGGLLGLAGTWVLVGGGGTAAPGVRWLGDVAALVAALSWAGYSVLSRRYAHLGVTAVGGYCAVTTLLALVGHLLWETWVWPDPLTWAAVLGIGLGPSGVAFFAWDHAVKRGSLATLGVLSYFAPLLSTTWLVLAGRTQPSWAVIGAALLIFAGAASASLAPRRPTTAPATS